MTEVDLKELFAFNVSSANIDVNREKPMIKQRPT